MPGSSGRALPGTRLKVVDPDTGALRGVGEKGELCVSGPQVMVGYLDRPDETARTVRDGWVHTGDLGYVDGEENVNTRSRILPGFLPWGCASGVRSGEAVLMLGSP